MEEEMEGCGVELERDRSSRTKAWTYLSPPPTAEVYSSPAMAASFFQLTRCDYRYSIAV